MTSGLTECPIQVVIHTGSSPQDNSHLFVRHRQIALTSNPKSAFLLPEHDSQLLFARFFLRFALVFFGLG